MWLAQVTSKNKFEGCSPAVHLVPLLPKAHFRLYLQKDATIILGQLSYRWCGNIYTLHLYSSQAAWRIDCIFHPELLFLEHCQPKIVLSCYHLFPLGWPLYASVRTQALPSNMCLSGICASVETPWPMVAIESDISKRLCWQFQICYFLDQKLHVDLQVS